MSLDAKDLRIAELESQAIESAATTAELEELVAKLTTQVELLLEKLGKNSGNSHLPPSSDGPGAAGRGIGRGGRSKKDKTDKKSRSRGGQKGHRGAHRQLVPPERVHEAVEMFPAVCEGCGHGLPATPDAEPTRHQVIDLAPIAPWITEFRRHEVQCAGCGYSTRADYDATKIPSSPFGPRLTTVVAMLTGVYHLSRRRAQQLLSEVFGIQISLGAISAVEARTSDALVSAVDEAQREVEQADVKHTDATTWLQAGAMLSLWTLATAAATVYKILKDGRRETIRSMFGALKGILVSDRASVFGFWPMRFRQICWAHLLRKFVSFSERDGPAGGIGTELLQYATLMFEYWHGFKDGHLTRDELQIWMIPLQRKFEAALARASKAEIRGVSGSCADILAHKHALWTFVTHDGVEPTNNHAERELREFVLWRRKSFGAQSDRGHTFAARVMTVAHTARKQGKRVFDFFVDCVTARRGGTTPPMLMAPVATA